MFFRLLVLSRSFFPESGKKRELMPGLSEEGGVRGQLAGSCDRVTPRPPPQAQPTISDPLLIYSALSAPCQRSGHNGLLARPDLGKNLTDVFTFQNFKC